MAGTACNLTTRLDQLTDFYWGGDAVPLRLSPGSGRLVNFSPSSRSPDVARREWQSSCFSAEPAPAKCSVPSAAGPAGSQGGEANLGFPPFFITTLSVIPKRTHVTGTRSRILEGPEGARNKDCPSHVFPFSLLYVFLAFLALFL